MFTTIRYIYNVYKLINQLIYIQNLDEDIDDKLLTDNFKLVKYYLNNIGFIGVKFMQWYVSNLMSIQDKKKSNINDKLINYFKGIFDNCEVHSLEYTKKIFKNDFKVELEEYISINSLKLIGSGSIGQVYYAKMKDTDLEVAIKVKHPTINDDLQKLNNFIYVLNWIKSINYYKHKFRLYLDYNDFKDYITKQVNFENEVENANKFQDLYENNKYIVIPKIYQYTQNIIVSKFEGGIEFNELSPYQKVKCANNFLCFVMNSFLIDNFVHGDLHIKNWKLQLMENKIDYKLVIYDLGICFSTDNVNHNRLLWESLEVNDKDGIFEFFNVNSNISVDNNNIKKETEDIFQDYYDNGRSITYLCNNLLNLLQKQPNIMLNKNLINILTFLNLIEDIILKEICIGMDTNNMILGIYNFHTNLLAYCKSKNIYKKLEEYIKLRSDISIETNKSEYAFFINYNNLKFNQIE